MKRRSRSLIDSDQNRIFDSDLAVAVGDREAIALQQIHYWCDVNEIAQKDTHFFGGQYWVYNTWNEWEERNFPFWSISTIRRVFSSLEMKGLISTRPQEVRNRGTWATINYDMVEALITQGGEHLRVRRQRAHTSKPTGGSAQFEQGGLLNLNRPSAQFEQATGYTENTSEIRSEIKSIAPIGAASPSSKKKRKPTTPIEDSAPTEDQSKSSNDVNAMISAWWEWVPSRPLLRGKVAEAKTHFANKAIRQHAENITKRGIGAADMARFLADVRFSTAGEKYFHLQEKPMGFTYAATILEEWVIAERAKRWYTWDQPRVTPARPGLSRDASTTNDELRLDPDFIVDVPGPYVTAQEAANGKPEFNTDPDPEPDNSNDAAILRKLGIPL